MLSKARQYQVAPDRRARLAAQIKVSYLKDEKEDSTLALPAAEERCETKMTM
jgi:hypothetical protein